jgi:hypothetical protein
VQPTSWRALLARPEAVVLLVTAFPLLENLIMANHASLYSYDRLKWIVFVAAVIALAIARWPQRRTAVLGLAAAAAAVSIVWFAVARLYVVPPSMPDLALYRDFGALVRRTAAGDALAFTNLEVRGTLIYYAGRNLYPKIEESIGADAMTLPDVVRRTLVDRGFADGVVYLLSGDRRSVEIVRISAVGNDIGRETVPLALDSAD